MPAKSSSVGQCLRNETLVWSFFCVGAILASTKHGGEQAVTRPTVCIDSKNKKNFLREEVVAGKVVNKIVTLFALVVASEPVHRLLQHQSVSPAQSHTRPSSPPLECIQAGKRAYKGAYNQSKNLPTTTQHNDHFHMFLKIFCFFSFCSRFCWGISLVVVAALLVTVDRCSSWT